MNFYLLEDDDKSITLYILYPQLMHIKYFVLYYYLFITLIMKYSSYPDIGIKWGRIVDADDEYLSTSEWRELRAQPYAAGQKGP